MNATDQVDGPSRYEATAPGSAFVEFHNSSVELDAFIAAIIAVFFGLSACAAHSIHICVIHILVELKHRNISLKQHIS